MSSADLDKIPSIIAIDCGNTSIDIALVREGDVSKKSKVSADDINTLPTVLDDMTDDDDRYEAIVACSVNDEAFDDARVTIENYTKMKIQVVGTDIPLPLPIAGAEPNTTGADRVCAAAAAYDELGKPCVIADFGSAITIDCVDADGQFLGGAIMPGLGMSAQTLAARTSKLPQIELVEPKSILMTTTEGAIANGIINGARHALRGFTEAYATELGMWPEVLLTGSDASIISEGADPGIVSSIVEDLTLRGVAMAYYKYLID